MAIAREIFKAYDVRGKVGTQLTEEVTYKIGQALGKWLPNDGPLAVGYDMRPDSKALAESLMKGAINQGRDVVNIGCVASDMIYFATGFYGYAGGATVTASHNPGDDNGIKFCREEAKPIGVDTGLMEIRDLAEADEFTDAEKPGEITEKSVLEDWINHALGFVEPDTWPAYRVAIDAGNGMAGAVIPALEGKVPLEIDPMYFELDGTFPNHIANPLVPENIVDIQNRICETGADFGIAFDGDGDRAVVIDENGEPLSGTVTTAILAEYFLAKNPGATILYNAVCGRVVPEVVAENGGKSERTKVGHSYIKDDMRKHQAVFAGEHSGHYYFKDNYFADSGLIAALVAIQVLAEKGGTMSQLADAYRQRYFVIPETNFTVEDKDATLTAVKEAYASEDMNGLDGLTVNFDDGWINIRASNTEPLLRLNAEARTNERLDELVSEATKLLAS